MITEEEFKKDVEKERETELRNIIDFPKEFYEKYELIYYENGIFIVGEYSFFKLIKTDICWLFLNRGYPEDYIFATFVDENDYMKIKHYLQESKLNFKTQIKNAKKMCDLQ